MRSDSCFIGAIRAVNGEPFYSDLRFVTSNGVNIGAKRLRFKNKLLYTVTLKESARRTRIGYLADTIKNGARDSFG